MNAELEKEIARMRDLRDKVNARLDRLTETARTRLDALDGTVDGRIDTGDIATKFDDAVAASPRMSVAISVALGAAGVLGWKFIAGAARALGLLL